MKNRSIITLSIATILALSCAYPVFAQAKDPEALVKEGDLLYRDGKYEEAAKIYEEAYILIKTAAPKPAEEPARKVESPEDIAEEAEALFKDKRYIEAAGAYGEAGKAYKAAARKTSKKLKIHKRNLEKLKALREEKRRELAEAKRLKEEYIKVLKARRAEDILMRRAKQKALALALKKEASRNWQSVREEKKKYKLERAKKRAAVIVQEREERLARERLSEEEKTVEAMTKGIEAAEKGPEVIKELKMVKAHGIEKMPYAITEKRESIFAFLSKIEEPKKAAKIVIAKEAAQEATVAAEEEKETEVESERLAVEEAARKKEELKLAKEAERREGFRKKASLIRGRISRIEEAMFKKREEKESKRREELKREAIKKAGRAKQELDNSILTPDIDKKLIEKGKLLIEKADNYFSREMFKEAGELYDRAHLTLRGKLH